MAQRLLQVWLPCFALVMCVMTAAGMAASSHAAKSGRGGRSGHHAKTPLRAGVTVAGHVGTAGASTSFRLKATLPRHDKLARYTLSFGDRSERKGSRLPGSARHTYAKAGHYSVVLTVVDRRGRRAGAKQRVVVHAASGGKPGGNPTGGDPGPALRAQLKTWLGSDPAVGDNADPTNQLNEEATVGSVSNLYPGALVQGNPSYITTGQLKPIPMAPGSGTLTLVGTHLEPSSGGTVTRHVSPATKANVATAVASLQGQSFNPNSVEAVASDFEVVTSSKQATLDAKASFSYGPVGASGFFDTADDSSQSHVLFTLREVYYDISYDPDAGSAGLSDLDAFLAPGTTVAQAQTCGCMSTSNPPMYVEKVTYGSEFLFMANSTADSSDLKAGLQAAVKAGFSASASVSTEQKAMLDQTNIKVLAVGGDTTNLATVISGSLGDDGKGVLSALKAYAQAAIADPHGAQLADPIAYTLDYIDNSAVGEFAPRPDARQAPPDSDTTQTMQLTVTTTDQDKDGGDPWTVSLTVPESSGQEQVLNGVSPTLTLPNPIGTVSASQLTFTNNSTFVFTVPLPQTIPVYDIPGSILTITDSGHSWHGGVNVAFKLPDGNFYRSFTSEPGMYWNDNNNDPNRCNQKQGSNQEVSTYQFALNELSDAASTAPACAGPA
jgi:hypothetical protein